MSRLIIVEKPDLYRIAHSYGLIPADADVVCTFGFGLWRATLPKSLSFADIPCLPEPVFDVPAPIALRDGIRLMRQDGTGGEPVRASHDGAALKDLVQRLNDRLAGYREVITLVDADHSGQWGAQQILDRLTAAPLPPVHAVWNERGLDEKSLREAWAGRQKNDPRVAYMVRYGQMKRTFDYWWACNSMLVFGELMKACDLDPAVPLSKNEVLILDWLGHHGSTQTIDVVHKTMQRWQGTGAYKRMDGVGAGSPASRHEIVRQLTDRGAIVESDNRELSITDKGQCMLGLLHPKTIDPDLPFRLHDWCESGNRDAMARYIRTLFGRQLRYQRRKQC